MKIKLANGSEYEALYVDGTTPDLLILHMQDTTLISVATDFTDVNLQELKVYEGKELQTIYTGYTEARYIAKENDRIVVHLYQSDAIAALQEQITTMQEEIENLKSKGQ